MAQRSIVTVTLNPALDASTSVPRVLPDRKLRCEQPTFEPGGGGINVARAIHRLGGAACPLWMSGGPTGELLGELLAAEGLVHEALPIAAATRENLTVLEEESGQQFRFGMPGAALAPHEVARVRAALRDRRPRPDYLVLSGSLPPRAAPDLFRRLIADCGAEPDGDAESDRHAEPGGPAPRIVLDTSGEALRCAVDGGGIYLLKPNLRELRQLAGDGLERADRIEAAARRLIEQGAVEVVVASLGAGGALLVTADACERVAAPTVPIRSRVGAGDSTVAGIVLALARGEPLSDAIRFGVAAGAAAVMTPGSELCRREDAERLAEELKSPAAT